MKRIYSVILTLVLLMAVTTAQAQFADKISDGDCTMSYAFSGGEITSGGANKYGDQYAQYHSYGCKIGKGGTISLVGRKEKGPDSLKTIIIQVRFTKQSASGYYNAQAAPEKKEIFKGGSGSMKIQIPEGTEYVNATITFMGRRRNRTAIYNEGYSGKDLICNITWRVEKTMVDHIDELFEGEEVPLCDCNKGCNGLIDSHIRFNDFYGQVMYRPNWEEDDSYEFADIDAVLYECYRIKTWEDSGAILGLEDMSTYCIRPESIIIIQTAPNNRTRFQMIMGALWGNVKKMAQGKSIKCEMSQCVAGISGTIVAFEEKNGVSKVTLFAGKVDVTSKKTKKKTVLKPGETSSVSKDGKIVVKKFNIEQEAKRLGIPMSEIRNHYSNTTTTTTATKRYDVERAIVKYKVTKGNLQGTMAKVFDNHGNLERRELKMGNQTTLQLTQGNTSYNLDRNAKTYQQVTNAELNFLNMNDPVMKKLNLQKKGTAKVLDRECTVYANSDTEFYVWKGIVLKKVAHTKKGTTTTEATSVELPTSVYSKYFNMPSGYTIKN